MKKLGLEGKNISLKQKKQNDFSHNNKDFSKKSEIETRSYEKDDVRDAYMTC